MFSGAAKTARAKIFGGRYDFDRRARSWLIFQMIALTVGFIVYLAAHRYYKRPTDSVPPPQTFVRVDAYGVVGILSPEDIDWYVGPDKSKPILLAINQRNREILEARQEITQLLAKAGADGGPVVHEALQRITEVFVASQYSAACKPAEKKAADDHCLAALTEAMEKVGRLAAATGTPDEQRAGLAEFAANLHVYRGALASWLDRSADPLSVIGAAQAELEGVALPPVTASALSEIRSRMARLQQLRADQQNDIDALRPPLKQMLFWMTPMGLLAEILCWGFFGVMTNTLLKTAAAMQKGPDGAVAFRPREVYVGLAKMVYGPAISFVLCLAILTGLFDLLGTDIRVWALPLVAFFFGFNSRKSAQLIDRLSEKIFGSAKQSIDEGPAGVAGRRAARLSVYTELLKPVSLADLQAKGAKLVDEVVQTIVTQKEARR